MDRMEAEKAAGNKAMAKGKYKDALRHYRKALSVADLSRIQDVSALHSNASLALVKMEQHEEVGPTRTTAGFKILTSRNRLRSFTSSQGLALRCRVAVREVSIKTVCTRLSVSLFDCGAAPILTKNGIRQ